MPTAQRPRKKKQAIRTLTPRHAALSIPFEEFSE
jgi:hypothetical protein